MQPIKILLGADMLLVRQTLRILLEGETDFLLVGEAGDATGTIALIKTLSPDVTLLDQGVLGPAPLERLRDLRRDAPKTRFIVLSSGCSKEDARNELKHYVAAVVYKKSSYPSLANAIRTVVNGDLNPSVATSISQTQTSLIENHAPYASPGGLLSGRQREILELASRGFTNREIALRLSISPRTVEVHRAKLMHKLALRDRADLLRFVFQSARFPRDGSI